MRRYLIAIGLVTILSIGIVGYTIYALFFSSPVLFQHGQFFDISYSFDQYPLYPNLETYVRIKVTSKLTETAPLQEVRLVVHWRLEDPISAQVESVYDQGNIAPHETRIIVIPIKIWGNVTEGTYTGWISIISQLSDFKEIMIEVTKNREVVTSISCSLLMETDYPIHLP